MTASRLRSAALCCGLFVVGPAAVFALRARGGLLALPLLAMGALALFTLLDRRRLRRAVRDQAASLDALHGDLRRVGSRDALTGLANRAGFVGWVEDATGASDPAPVAVLLVDLDDFTAVNGMLGHRTGDELLRGAAQRVADAASPAEVARVDGDEFGVVLRGATDASATAEAVHAALRAPFELQGGHMLMHVSIGIAFDDAGGATADELLRQAGVAVAAAKRQGKARTQVFGPDLADGAADRVLRRAALAAALDAGALELNYQPIVELVSGRVWGVEALSRWTDGERGPVAPAEFIPLSEESGLIHQLGRFVLARACAEAVGWPGGLAAPVLSVNVSSSQLEDPTIVSAVADALTASGLGGERLMVEVPDVALLDQGRAGRDRLAALRELGVRVAVDGFGAGSSSLRHLPRFPVDVIKIDQALVRGIDDGPAGLAVLRAIVDLADQLGIDTVAEGIEEIRQADALASIGCRSGQGFWYRRPVPAAQLWPLPSGGVLRPRARAH
jgi:diguanylate cyclase (GGDEF)-like protein